MDGQRHLTDRQKKWIAGSGLVLFFLLSALVCWFAGGIVGIGTAVCAFGLGPFISFFDTHFSKKLVEK